MAQETERGPPWRKRLRPGKEMTNAIDRNFFAGSVRVDNCGPEDHKHRTERYL
jgi:hypothetical protein